MIRISQLKMPLGHTRKDLLLKAAKELRIQPEMIKEVELIKQSVDARKKPEIHYSYIVDIALKAIEEAGKKTATAIVVTNGKTVKLVKSGAVDVKTAIAEVENPVVEENVQTA